MTNQASVHQFMPHGLDESNIIYSKAVVPGAVTATSGTLTLTPVAGIDITTTPIYAIVLRPGTAPQQFYPITLTSFDPTTGTIVLTNGGTALQAADVVYLVSFVNQ